MDSGTGDTKPSYRTLMCALLRLGTWFDTLRQQGVYDNTRIIIVSDHGFDLGLFGFELADKYETLPKGDFEHQEHWSDTMVYNPLLLVKNFNATGFTIDNTFMTNADTPTLALKDIVENPVNPFTGSPINSDAKDAPEQHVIETDFDTGINNGTTFLNPIRINVKNKDIFNLDNWTVDGAK